MCQFSDGEESIAEQYLWSYYIQLDLLMAPTVTGASVWGTVTRVKCRFSHNVHTLALRIYASRQGFVQTTEYNTLCLRDWFCDLSDSVDRVPEVSESPSSGRSS